MTTKTIDPRKADAARVALEHIAATETAARTHGATLRKTTAEKAAAYADALKARNKAITDGKAKIDAAKRTAAGELAKAKRTYGPKLAKVRELHDSLEAKRLSSRDTLN